MNFKSEIDLFASRNNCQIEIFSWKPEPESYAIDAFSISWTNIKLSSFPPFSVIPADLQKMVVEKAKGILVMPNWPTQPYICIYYATVMKMLIAKPFYVPRRKTLLQLPGKNETQ